MTLIEDKIDELNKLKIDQQPTIEDFKESLEHNKDIILSRLATKLGEEEYVSFISYDDLANELLDRQSYDEDWKAEYLLSDEVKNEIISIISILGLVANPVISKSYLEIGTKRYFQKKYENDLSEMELRKKKFWTFVAIDLVMILSICYFIKAYIHSLDDFIKQWLFLLIIPGLFWINVALSKSDIINRIWSNDEKKEDL